MGSSTNGKTRNRRTLFPLLVIHVFTIAVAFATSSSAFAETPEAPDFRVIKSIDRPVVASGETVVFRLEVTNFSGTELSNVKLDDSVPHGFTYVAGSAKIQVAASPAAARSDPRPIGPGTNTDGVLSFLVGRLP